MIQLRKVISFCCGIKIEVSASSSGGSAEDIERKSGVIGRLKLTELTNARKSFAYTFAEAPPSVRVLLRLALR